MFNGNSAHEVDDFDGERASTLKALFPQPFQCHLVSEKPMKRALLHGIPVAKALIHYTVFI